MSIQRLGDISKTQIEDFGGKAVNLGEMIQIGLPVPPGFCLSTSIYQKVVENESFTREVTEDLKQQRWTAVAKKAERYFLQHPLDLDWKNEIARFYDGELVAVRSSATAEDLEDASFAGQQETFLNVQGLAEVGLAVRKCWASLWSERALVYRHERGMDHLQVRIAVIVQKMIPAEVAGVAFSADPIEQKRDQILIEAIPGLGEQLVSGETNGDVYRVKRQSTLDIFEKNPAGDAPVLSDSMIRELCGKIVQLEKHFACPQDIEFAFYQNQLYLLQSRPITTMYDDEIDPSLLTEKLSPPQQLAMYKAAERFPVPPKPLDNFVFSVIVTSSVSMYRSLGLATSSEKLEEILRQRWRDVYMMPTPRPTFRIFKLPKVLKTYWTTDWMKWWVREARVVLQDVTRPISVSELSHQALVDKALEVRQAWLKIFQKRLSITMSMYAAEFFLFELVALAVGRKEASGTMAKLLSGMDTDSIDVNKALWNLSRLAKNDPEVVEMLRQRDYEGLTESEPSKDFTRATVQFFQSYGHREGTGWYLSTPTWKNGPDQVWDLIKTLMEMDKMPQSTSWYQETQKEVAHKLRYYPFVARFFQWILRVYRDLYAFEENSHLDLTRPLSFLQEIASEWGARLTRSGLLNEPDDVYYLDFDEVKTYLTKEDADGEEIKKTIIKRKAVYRWMVQRWSRHLNKDSGGRNELAGYGASPGLYKGTVRIIKSEEDFGQLLPGEILVCPYTNPSWTPLFAVAGAVITETGSIVSHAAIVAREYGIPAVLGIKGITKSLKSGQIVRVDGSRGEVIPVKVTEEVR